MDNTDQTDIKLVLGKLYKIMSEVERIDKDKRNTHQSYEYASEKIIKEVLHEQFVKHKIIMQLETENPTIQGAVTFLQCTYHFIDTESGQRLSGKFVGSGQSRDEKGNYAAVTGAIKYILTSTFLIPTGDDPEKDENDLPKKASQTTQDHITLGVVKCEACGQKAEEKEGKTKQGKPYHGIFCSTGEKTHTRWLPVT